MYELTVESAFSAAHRLRNYQGKCENLHGHNWRVEVTIASNQLDNKGMVIDFRKIKEKLGKVLDKLDHTYLNELSEFKKVNPTSENIASYIYSKLKNLIKEKKIIVKRVSVWETKDSSATYWCDKR